MKKHRNFLIFYAFWLGTIFSLLAIFDTPQDEQLLLKTNSTKVCKAQTTTTKYSQPAKSNAKWYCASKQADGLTRPQKQEGS